MKAVKIVAWLKSDDIGHIRPFHVVQAVRWGSASPDGYREATITLIDHQNWHDETDQEMVEIMETIEAAARHTNPRQSGDE